MDTYMGQAERGAGFYVRIYQVRVWVAPSVQVRVVVSTTCVSIAQSPYRYHIAVRVNI